LHLPDVTILWRIPTIFVSGVFCVLYGVVSTNVPIFMQPQIMDVESGVQTKLTCLYPLVNRTEYYRVEIHWYKTVFIGWTHFFTLQGTGQGSREYRYLFRFGGWHRPTTFVSNHTFTQSFAAHSITFLKVRFWLVSYVKFIYIIFILFCLTFPLIAYSTHFLSCEFASLSVVYIYKLYSMDIYIW
jgi:hypothetical protein